MNPSKRTQEAVKVMADYVNVMTDENHQFCALMGRDHRTIQQCFTKLCLEWLEYVAHENYQYDQRNEDSHKIAQFIIHQFKERQRALGYTGESLEMMSKPSKFLPLI